jgi:hypothetical protein
MEDAELEALVRNIVKLSKELKDKYTKAASAPVNYACVFSHSKVEYDGLIEAAGKIGKVIDNTSTGPVFLIKPIETVAGRLKLLKIRIPDPTRPERGDADFTVPDYDAFKASCLKASNFKLIKRKKSEMIELMELGSSVRAYFSKPPLDRQLGI